MIFQVQLVGIELLRFLASDHEKILFPIGLYLKMLKFLKRRYEMNKRLNSIKALKFLILVFLVSFLAVSLISCGKSKEQQAKEFFNLGITYYKQNKTPEAVIDRKSVV